MTAGPLAVQPPALELFDPMRPETLKDPYRSWGLLRRHCPVGYLEPLDLWVVSRYGEAKTVLSQPDAFSAALAFGPDSVISDARSPGRWRLSLRFAGDSGGVVSASDGDRHAGLRRGLARLFARPRLDAVERSTDAYVRRIVAALARRGTEVDLVTELAKPVAAATIGSLIGMSPRTSDALAHWVDETFRCLDPGDRLSTAAAGDEVLRTNLAAARAVASFLNQAARAAPEDQPPCFAESWRQAGTPAARELVVLSVLHLFQAGYETVVSAMSALLERFVLGVPRSPLLEPGRGDVAPLVEESLRLSSPVRATFRTATRPGVLGGVPVPAGARIMVLLGSANRDPDVFPAPDRVLTGRTTPHFAFGGGPHRCLGRTLAHLELRQVLGVLADTSEGMTPAGEPVLSANILKAGHERLPVRVRWRAGG